MKKLVLLSFILLLSLFWLGCKKKKTSIIQMRSFPDWEAVATLLMERIDLVEGEQVILIAKPGRFDPLVSLFSEKIFKRGAIYQGTFSVDSSLKPVVWETDFVKQAKGKNKNDLVHHFM